MIPLYIFIKLILQNKYRAYFGFIVFCFRIKALY